MQFCFFFFHDTATTDIYTLSLHDALPIFLAPWLLKERPRREDLVFLGVAALGMACLLGAGGAPQRTATNPGRSEEHTSELQSRGHLVCRLLLEKKKEIRTAQLVPPNGLSR